MSISLPPFVTWDRGGDAGDDVVVFGWIYRSDGQRDFALVLLSKATGEQTFYATSSAKYSRELSEFYGDLDNHNDCLPFEEVLALIDKRTPA